MTKDGIFQRLLESLKSFYNIHQEVAKDELAARCDYFEHSESFMVSRKANLWTADCEEFLYIFKTESLSPEIYLKSMKYVEEDWKNHAHIGPGHMYTYVTAVFISESIDADAVRMMKKCRVYKNFKFGFHGWMEFHVAGVDAALERIFSNGRGRGVRKMLSKVLGIRG